MGAHVELDVGVKTGAVAAGLREVQHEISSFKNEVGRSIMGLFAFEGVKSGIEAIIEKARNIRMMSEQFGMTTESVQKISNAAKATDVPIDSVRMAINRMVVAQEKARAGSNEMRDAFAAFGLTMEDVAGAGTDELFFKIADGYAHAEDQGRAYNAVVALMGRNAGRLVPLLKEGKDGIEELGNAQGVMASSDVAELQRLGVQIDRISNQFKIFFGHAIVWGKTFVEEITTVFTGWAIDTYDILGGLKDAFTKLFHGDFKGAAKEFSKAAWTATGGQLVASTDPRASRGQQAGRLAREDVEVQKQRDESEEDTMHKSKQLEISQEEVREQEHLTRLQEELNSLQKEAAEAKMTAEAKIKDLVARRLALEREAAELEAKGDKVGAMQKRVEAARLQKQQSETEQKQQSETDALREHRQALLLKQREAAITHQEHMERAQAEQRGTSERELADIHLKANAAKAAELRQTLIRQQTDAIAETDPVRRQKKSEAVAETAERIQALQYDSAETAERIRAPQVRAVSADQLARIGGGGGVARMGGADAHLVEAKTTNTLLREINQKLTPDEARQLLMKP